MWRLLFLLIVLPGLASAQGLGQSPFQLPGQVPDRSPSQDTGLVATLPGLYGSASDPAGSCLNNPHKLAFMTMPPHLLLTWPAPWKDSSGRTRFNRRYDLLAIGTDTLTLRWEADPERLADGRRPIWILRHTTRPEGYCWGREDWPELRCIDQQVRCDAPVS